MSKVRFLKGIRNLALIYLFLLILLYGFQDKFIFPAKKYEPVITAGVTSHPLQGNKGIVAEILIKEPVDDKAPIYLYLPGNAEGYDSNDNLVEALTSNGDGLAWLVYRGYGRSVEKPSEQGFYDDAHATLAFLKMKYKNKIIVIGRSIGSGVAVEVAKNNNVAGLVLWSPFTSLEEIAASQYPYFPVKSMGLVRSKFNSAAKIISVNEPVLIIIGANDKLVPVSDSEKLFALANEPKKKIIVADSDHYYFNVEKVVAEIKTFAAGG